MCHISFWEELRYTGTVQVAESESDFDPDPDLYTEDSFDVDYQFLHTFGSAAVGPPWHLTMSPSAMAARRPAE